MHQVLGILLIAAGLFAIAGAVLNWEWFMNARKARTIVGLFGRTGARVFYVILGLFLCVLSALLLTGVSG
jgi:small neutral amino acid transporter SnatA (MarC family)